MKFLRCSRFTVRAACMVAMLLAFTGMGATVLAQGYPSKSIKLVIPFPAGSGTDAMGRIVAQAMGEALGQSTIVENKAGANGILGASAVKAAPADGYTLLMTTSTTHAANVSLYKKLPYDPVTDFTPIGKVAETGFILVVRSDFPARDMKEFIAYAKANPGKLAYGHGSSGSLVSAALLGQMAGLDFVSVAYKGIPQAVTDLLGGQLQFAFVDAGNAVPHMNSGRLRGLGVTTARRSSKAPQVPPVGDTVKDYLLSSWLALVAPAGLPPDVAAKLESTFQAVMAKPEVREKIQGAGMDVDVQNAAQLARTIDSEIRKWALWVKAANITPE